MTREEAKKIAEAMMAYAEGKNMEFSRWGAEDWRPCDNPSFQCNIYRYRVQPEPKYRPFKDAKECWEEMKKHEQIGWIKSKRSGRYRCIGVVDTNCVCFGPNYQCTYQCAFDCYTFADGSLFGVKEE